MPGIFRMLRDRRNRQRLEIDEEIESHLDARIEYLIERGMSPEEARAEALRKFGDLESGRAALHAMAAPIRPRLGLRDYLHDLIQDAKYVGRGLLRAPAFTAGVVATLALGLGINTAVFRVADFVLFRPPAGVSDARGMRWVESSTTFDAGAPTKYPTFSYADALRIASSRAFAGTSVYSPPRVMPAKDGTSVGVEYVDDAFFRILGARTAAGRPFDAREGAPGSAQPVAVVSFDYWRRALASPPIDAHTEVALASGTYTVIGVAAEGFTGIDTDPVDVWLPLGVADLGHSNINGVIIPWYQSDSLRAVRVIGRVPPHQTDDAIASKLAAAVRASDDDENKIRRAPALHAIVPIGGTARNQEPNILLGRLTIISAIVLVIACANVVNLLLARGLRRHQEIAIRMAIGASRSRVSRLLVIESVLLALMGGGAAAIVGQWTSESLRRLLFPDAHWTTSAFDQRTIVFTALLALAAGLIAGLAPALQSTTPDLVTGLKSSRVRGSSRTRATRASMIVVQTALSLALLIASGLLVRSLLHLNAVPLGFQPGGLVTATVDPSFDLPGTGAMDAEHVAEQMRAIPRAQAVALASSVPFGSTSSMDITVPGTTFVPASRFDSPQWSAVSANYFSVMGTRAIQGRVFTAEDSVGGEPVAVINQSMASHYFPASIPPGSCIHPSSRPCYRIVGVVEDIRDAPGGAPPPLRFYLPLTQWTRGAAGVIVRTTDADAPFVARAFRTIIPQKQRTTIEVISDRVGRAMQPWHQALLLFAVFGIIALALACLGVYSVMSYIASERIHELGMRVVLGATGGDIMRLVLGEGLRLTMIGGLVGVLIAAATGRLLGTLLFGVSALDPLVYTLGLVCLAGAGVLAVLGPALGASRVDPISALRTD